MYDRTESTEIEVIDRWSTGVGWIAHPAEDARSASHATTGDDGVWVFDPLDGPGVLDQLADPGDVAGVAVLSRFHSRDAADLAARYGVSVHLAKWMAGVADATEPPVE